MTLALVEAVNGETAEQDHANGVRRHRPHQPRRRVSASNGTHGKAEVSDDTRLADEHEGPGRIHVLGRQAIAAEPAIEIVVA